MSFVKLLKTAILQRTLVNICSVKLKIDIYLLVHHYLCIYLSIQKQLSRGVL